jgi:hypothetical protein
MSKKTGGPAFPITKESRLMVCSEGMTLRDYFAAKAMQGWLGSRARVEDARLLAEAAYIRADAMISEREK